MKEKIVLCNKEFNDRYYEKVKADHNFLEDFKKWSSAIIGEEPSKMIKFQPKVIFTGSESVTSIPFMFDVYDIFPLKLIKFEGIDLFCPRNFEKVLTEIYGDYMKFPQRPGEHLCKKFDENSSIQLIEKLKNLREAFNDSWL